MYDPQSAKVWGGNESGHMALIRPRLTDHYGVALAQAQTDFVIPYLTEDIPLYVDPFLLWKSPSLQEQSLHLAVVNAFNYLGYLVKHGRQSEATALLIQSSECDHIGLGFARNRIGRKLNTGLASQLLGAFVDVPMVRASGFVHVETAQLLVEGFGKDRISDVFCSLAKSHVVDYTMLMSEECGIPTTDVDITGVFNHSKHAFETVRAKVPVHPETKAPILLIPKRWVRKAPWIGFDDYVESFYKREVLSADGTIPDRPRLINFNRDNFGIVEKYVRAKELQKQDCTADPLFKQMPVISAKRHIKSIMKIPTGKTDGADKRYEESAGQLLATILYPYLDYAADQVRTDSGAHIRDVVFYNTRSLPFLKDIHRQYESVQLVFELKNVLALETEHINQLNRYLVHEFGRFGVVVTRNPAKRAVLRNIVDLWSAHRRLIIPVTDVDLEKMVDVYESGQRRTLDILHARYLEIVRSLPS